MANGGADELGLGDLNDLSANLASKNAEADQCFNSKDFDKASKHHTVVDGLLFWLGFAPTHTMRIFFIMPRELVLRAGEARHQVHGHDTQTRRDRAEHRELASSSSRLPQNNQSRSSQCSGVLHERVLTFSSRLADCEAQCNRSPNCSQYIPILAGLPYTTHKIGSKLSSIIRRP